MLTGQILLQIIVVILTAQMLGYLCHLIKQQRVIGEILAGLVLGPSLLGIIWPTLKLQLFPASTLPTLQTFGDIGLILYMFSLGARLDTQLMLRQSRTSIIVSLSGIILPLLSGSLLGYILYPGLAGSKATLLTFMLFVGTAMAITAFPVLARLLTEKNMLNTRIGMQALTCASVDDVIAWCLLAFIVALTHAQGALIIVTIGLTVLFAVVMLFVVRPFFKSLMKYIHSSQLQTAISIIMLLGAAYTTNALGIHPVFGAFLAGIIIPRNIVFTAQIRELDKVNGLLFLPLFFVFSGLQTQIGLIQSPLLWLICFLILVTACGGKILGAALAVWIINKSWRDALALGILMNTRGLVELIVLNIGLTLGVLSPTIFSMLVITAIITTMMASPLLHLLGYTSNSQQMQEKPYDPMELEIPLQERQ